jgi:hypothetical protein
MPSGRMLGTRIQGGHRVPLGCFPFRGMHIDADDPRLPDRAYRFSKHRNP